MKYLDGNRLTLLCNGEQYFPALVEAIDAARFELFLETYIYADDETGSLVTDALARAAARGVAVHLLIDGFGARNFAPRFRRMLREAGAHVLVFRPNISPWSLRRNRLRRLHRKLACVDGRLAFVGGINVIDDYDSPTDTTPPPRLCRACRRADRRGGARGRDALWSRVAWTAGQGRLLPADAAGARTARAGPAGGPGGPGQPAAPARHRGRLPRR